MSGLDFHMGSICLSLKCYVDPKQFARCKPYTLSLADNDEAR